VNLELLKESIRRAARADFSRSGGPGGQNVNKLNTKVRLKLNLNDLNGLSPEEAAHLRESLKFCLTKGGELVVTSSEERSQLINLERAHLRMEAIIVNSSRLPRVRRPTKPSKKAKEDRLKAKRIQSEKKKERRFCFE
jgi:ribosome-associated protein